MYDLIIIGGGPAGVAAGVYASRKKLNALLLTKDFGGQAITSAKIENFIGHIAISGLELAQVLETQLRAQKHIVITDGITVERVTKIDGGFSVVDSKGRVYDTKTILVTLGSIYRHLNIPGERAFSGKGVFYCATCDAPLMQDKAVVVIGGGNSGLEAARDLLPFASHITILEFAPMLKGDMTTQELLRSDPKITIVTQAQTKEIVGDTFVRGLTYVDRTTNEEKNLAVEGVFVAIGMQPNSGIVSDLVDITPNGNIIVDKTTFQSSLKGIWAAGDITDASYNQINTAIGEAIKAVLNISEALAKKEL
ncbi:MAG: alkyl hydroperoxide reductase subunit F [Candidatus Wolfebacteria bacterium GW2011_GWB1_47_1]|nr:MAG: alkyl hydroperoxide reductase subunit F [Candidatus Wolfebacteria bacterium GW2011_GWB1_47_1]